VAFLQVLEKAPETSLHLVGKEEQTSYSVEIKNFIQQNGLQEKVFLYGEQENIPAFLEQANLGVLSSISEGMPLALLEYGRAGLAVVCTDVGQCKEVLGVEGGVVPSQNSLALAQAILNYKEDGESRKKDGEAFKNRISSHFSEEIVMKDLLCYFMGMLGQNQ
jgi:glycosyltransferase involved in cell wall biosynthesis